MTCKVNPPLQSEEGFKRCDNTNQTPLTPYEDTLSVSSFGIGRSSPARIAAKPTRLSATHHKASPLRDRWGLFSGLSLHWNTLGNPCKDTSSVGLADDGLRCSARNPAPLDRGVAVHQRASPPRVIGGGFPQGRMCECSTPWKVSKETPLSLGHTGHIRWSPARNAALSARLSIINHKASPPHGVKGGVFQGEGLSHTLKLLRGAL